MNFRKYNVAFVLALLAISCLLIVTEILARKIPNVYGYKSQELLRNNGHFKTLILGSSHTFFGINPEYLSDSSFNAANLSQDINYDRYILENSLSTLKDLEVVIMPISTFSLFTNLESDIESWRKYNYRHWFGYSEYPLEELFNIKTHSIIFYHPKIFSLARDFYRYFFTDRFEPTWSNKGWGTAYTVSATEKTLSDSGKTAAKRHQRASEFSERNLKSLKDIVEICKKNNLRLLIVTLPAYETYRSELDSKRLDAMTEAAIHYASSSNIKYLNYLSDVRFIKTDFHDADHLSHKGAQKFTQIINHEIEEW